MKSGYFYQKHTSKHGKIPNNEVLCVQKGSKYIFQCCLKIFFLSTSRQVIEYLRFGV